MSPTPDRAAFESFYAAPAPWDIGKPQGPNAKERVVGHVLHDFSSEEKEALTPLLDRAVDMARAWLSLGLAEAMNRHNRR